MRTCTTATPRARCQDRAQSRVGQERKGPKSLATRPNARARRSPLGVCDTPGCRQDPPPRCRQRNWHNARLASNGVWPIAPWPLPRAKEHPNNTRADNHRAQSLTSVPAPARKSRTCRCTHAASLPGSELARARRMAGSRGQQLRRRSPACVCLRAAARPRAQAVERWSGFEAG